jgi:hypothetical protein
MGNQRVIDWRASIARESGALAIKGLADTTAENAVKLFAADLRVIA